MTQLARQHGNSPEPAAPSASGKELIEITNVEKRFSARAGGIVHALSDINLNIRDREFVSVVGPSGCGKTTLLRILAGLERASHGAVHLAGRPIVAPRDDAAVVFQQAVLLPWSTVLDNVLLPVSLKGRISPESREKARQLLAFPHGTAGFRTEISIRTVCGMQQRVSICRALMRDPKLLLMDEPFGALDAMTRETMNVELMRVWSEQSMTVFFITHSIPEAVLLGDRVVVMSPRPGRISEIVNVDLPRPRDLRTMAQPRFGELCDHIRNLFGAETNVVSSL
jgi:NitT/TauT family transport system ATP-binding protein